MKTKFVILGTSGDIGNSFINFLTEKGNIDVNAYIREGSIYKLSLNKKELKNSKHNFIEIKTIFDKKTILNIMNTGDSIFNFIGMVSLNYQIPVYPEVLLVNSIFPGLLNKLNTRNIPIIYISTQRIAGILNNPKMKKWLNIANNFISELINKENYKYEFLLKKCNIFFHKHKLPQGINIYEATKLLGEKIMNNNGIILRVSSVYGPHCSNRRTVGRMIFHRIIGQEHNEKEEIRDYIFNKDLCEVLYKIANTNNYINEYCASGETMSKAEIAKLINEFTNKSSGKLTINTSEDGKVENFKPENTWFRRTLERNPLNIEDGLQLTSRFVDQKYKYEPTASRLNGLYDNISQQSSESGISTEKVIDLKKQFFHKKSKHWIAEESIWKPTGLAFGYPFTQKINQKIDQIKETIIDMLKLDVGDYWSVDTQHRHTTLISYTHFSEVENSPVQLPIDQYDVADKIIKKYSPISIKYKGIVVTTNGAVLIKGFVDNEQIFHLRNELLHTISGITQRPQILAHSTLMYILKDIPYQQINTINRQLYDIYIGKTIFKSVTTSSGQKFKFKNNL